MIRFTAVSRSLAVAIVCAALMVACGSDSTAPARPSLTPSNAVVSSPGDDGLVYVAMAEVGNSTVPTIVSNHRTGTSFQTVLVSGGFDPKTIEATVGDTLWFTEHFSSKDSTVTYAVVPESSQPKLMRTVPADGADSVDVHDSLVAIFSEPVDLTSLAAGVHVQPFDGTPLDATVSDCGATWCARLAPSVPLPGFSNLQLFGSASVTSHGGTVAAQPFSVSFTTGAPTTWPAGLGAPPLVVKSFTVIEFEAAGDTLHQYAPLLTVLNSGSAIVDLATFDFSVPGIGDSQTGACDDITVAPGDTAVVFLGWRGTYDISVALPGHRATGNATGTLQYFSAGYVANMDLSSAVTAGQPPAESANGSQRWSPYCP